ncbi:MAG TPA: PAS domain S-box protein [Syntrophales bacterium]|nr:PAS domain S-box protein [Syntrophales bacterium]HPX11181.1 PAS domain S-box protein [Syntrophales bacterium]HQB29240.1 PAS domain S-box protein [Syntrophales bacterium]HQN76745.1 PAS domain S-box protein [Syntrophales bacterium]HQQ26098.1 PAS domain S-box protein [Syntrophales bacterium]
MKKKLDGKFVSPGGKKGRFRGAARCENAADLLDAAEAGYRFLAGHAGYLAFTVDLSLRTLHVTPSVKEILGFTPEERVTQTPEEQLTPRCLALIRETLERELERERREGPDPERTVTLELEYRHRDGSIRYLECTFTGIRNESLEVQAICGIATDVTGHKAVEKALKESEERFRTLADHAPFGISLMRPDLSFEYFNPRFIEIFGYTLKDVPDKMTWFEKAYTDPMARAAAAALWKSDLQDEPEKGTARERVLSVRSRNGRDKTIRIFSVLMAGDRHLVTYEDITERKLLEDKLTQAQKMEAIGTLAGGVAHDFNNLLMGIQGHVSLTLLELNPEHPHYRRLKSIEELVQSGSDLTRQLLGFAREGRYAVKSSDMNEILRATASLFGRTKKEVSINGNFEKDLWKVEVDPGQMEQVFMSLFVNAWQAMPGGGTIALETANVVLGRKEVDPWGMKAGRYVRISVADTGTGMDEKTRLRIFDPFFTTKEMGRGTGLGLSMVYGIVSGHGGIIDVTSEPDSGTTFLIHLPASEKVPAREEALSDTLVKGRETILLVDDEEMVLQVTEELLECLGYAIVTARSGGEAVELFLENEGKIDLVILDMIMPGMSGARTFECLRAIDPAIRVLLSSGYSMAGQAQEIMDRGCNGFLQKPFRMENLSRKIQDILSTTPGPANRRREEDGPPGAEAP